jgi:hypothetical protein
MVVTLPTRIIRRTFGALDAPAQLDSSELLVWSNELGWPEARQQSEISAVQAFYDRRATAP